MTEPTVLVAESLDEHTVRVTFSTAMLLNQDLCDPSRYVFSDDLRAVRVRRLTADTVLVTTTRQQEWHTYRLRVEGA